MRAAVLVFSAMSTLTACAQFDSQEQLKDLRVLAVKIEPAEIMYSPFYVFTNPGERPPPPFLILDEYDVTATAFVFDPRGGTIQSKFQFCPEGQGVCDEYDPEDEIETAPDGFREELEDVYLPVEREGATTAEDRARNPSGLLQNQTYDYRFSTAVIDSIIRNKDGVAGIDLFPALPRFTIDALNPAMPEQEVNREVAFKRYPITLDIFDPALPVEVKDALAGALGASICPGGPPDMELYEEGRTTCLSERDANKNPVILGFDLFNPAEEREAREQDGTEEIPFVFKDSAELGKNPVIEVNPGATINLRPVFPLGTREPYQVFSFDVAAQKLTIENRLEDLALAWHATRGSVPASTNGELGNVSDVAWNLPRNRDPGERDSLVLVARDQRGGVDVATITVVYR